MNDGHLRLIFVIDGYHANAHDIIILIMGTKTLAQLVIEDMVIMVIKIAYQQCNMVKLHV